MLLAQLATPPCNWPKTCPARLKRGEPEEPPSVVPTSQLDTFQWLSAVSETVYDAGETKSWSKLIFLMSLRGWCIPYTESAATDSAFQPA